MIGSMPRWALFHVGRQSRILVHKWRVYLMLTVVEAVCCYPSEAWRISRTPCCRSVCLHGMSSCTCMFSESRLIQWCYSWIDFVCEVPSYTRISLPLLFPKVGYSFLSGITMGHSCGCLTMSEPSYFTSVRVPCQAIIGWLTLMLGPCALQMTTSHLQG